MSSYDFIRATTIAEYNAAGDLFREYAASLDFDLCFQDFDRELREIQTQYQSPSGGLILVQSSRLFVGCAGVRLFQDGIAELKRMYVRPAHRGQGLGRKLLQEALDLARELNYERIRLDTITTMTEAKHLYVAAGFYPIDEYRFNPVGAVLYFEKKLR